MPDRLVKVPVSGDARFFFNVSSSTYCTESFKLSTIHHARLIDEIAMNMLE